MEAQEIIISFLIVTQKNQVVFLSIQQASSEQVVNVLKSLRSGKLIEMNMYM